MQLNSFYGSFCFFWISCVFIIFDIGNPRVTPEVTRDVCLLARMMAANLYYSRIEDLMFEVSKFWWSHYTWFLRIEPCLLLCFELASCILMIYFPLHTVIHVALQWWTSNLCGWIASLFKESCKALYRYLILS